MGKKSKFDRLNEWIKIEYDRETKEIEDSLSDDGSFDPNRVDSEELFRRIQARIKEKEEQGFKEKEKKKVGESRFQVRKWAALFCVAIIGVFLASMTSEANRSYLVYKVQYLVGDEVVLNEGNEVIQNNPRRWQKEKKEMQDIEEELGVSIPYFRYMLDLYTNDIYNIQYGNTVVVIEYQCGDSIVNLRAFNRNRADISGIDFQGKVIKELSLMKGTVNMSVMEIKGTEDKEPTLAAQWIYKDGYYQLSGKVEEGEFIEILESIAY